MEALGEDGGGGGGRASSKAGVYVLEPVGQALMGGQNSVTMESSESSSVGVLMGKKNEG